MSRGRASAGFVEYQKERRAVNDMSMTSAIIDPRGLAGVTDYPGEIRVGDEVEVRVYKAPVIRLL